MKNSRGFVSKVRSYVKLNNLKYLNSQSPYHVCANHFEALGIKKGDLSYKTFCAANLEAINSYLAQKKLKLKKSKKNLPKKVEFKKSKWVSFNQVGSQSSINPASNDFLSTYEWRITRMKALKKHGAKCQCCGASAATGSVIHVDHIKPRRIYPELALDVNNLQILCHECNHGKGNWDMTDWRKSKTDEITH
jgi:5-methylcytosine-specific restriction endonuclease McrA